MFRTQLYADRSIDPERPEFYQDTSKIKNGYSISLKEKTRFSPGSKFWFFFKSNYWQPFKSISCRFLMISYSIFFIVETAIRFQESLILLNLCFVFLIIADCYVVICVRKGLEDRWCSLSIIYFICANTGPLWLLEINYGTILSTNIFNPEHIHHITMHYKELNNINNMTLLASASLKNNQTTSVDNAFLEKMIKEKYSYILEKHEALFCLVLIISRIFIPQVTLTWSAISSQSEFSFNTIIDIYSTISLCRDARLNLPKYITILTFILCNGALFPIALNILPDSETEYENLRISRLRQLTDNFYFRLIIQTIFSDFPLLVLRLIILLNLRFVRKEMYYLLAKQVVIILCKIIIMVYNWIKNTIERIRLNEIKRMNETV